MQPVLGTATEPCCWQSKGPRPLSSLINSRVHSAVGLWPPDSLADNLSKQDVGFDVACEVRGMVPCF
jgi:hypothetical protein